MEILGVVFSFNFQKECMSDFGFVSSSSFGQSYSFVVLLIMHLAFFHLSSLILLGSLFVFISPAEREAANAAERAERKLQLRDKVSCIFFK